MLIVATSLSKVGITALMASRRDIINSLRLTLTEAMVRGSPATDSSSSSLGTKAIQATVDIKGIISLSSRTTETTGGDLIYHKSSKVHSIDPSIFSYFVQ